MFTGLIEKMGTIRRVEPMPDSGRRLVVEEASIAPELKIGDSVAVNGACLTVVSLAGDSFDFQVGPETLAKTNLHSLMPGDRVNLERSLRVGDRLGGHFVQGHVDCVGTVDGRARDGEWELVWFRCPKELTRLMVPRGSIAVDGVSLTVVQVEDDRFMVMLIPHTLDQTTLGFRNVGDAVNLEADMLAKHVQKLVAP